MTNPSDTQNASTDLSDKFADVELVQFMAAIGFELSHHEGIADWFTRDEGTSELTVYAARDIKLALTKLIRHERREAIKSYKKVLKLEAELRKEGDEDE